jgi:kynureninase
VAKPVDVDADVFRCAAIEQALAGLGTQALSPANVQEFLWPLFRRVCNRREQDPHPAIYLANHSLGRPLDQMALDVQEALDLWYDQMDGAWSAPRGWLAASNFFRAQIAELIGAASYRQIVPKVSAGQGLRAVLNALSDHGHVPAVLATRGEFDSCDVILKTYAAKGRANVRWVEPSVREGIDHYGVADLTARLDADVDLILCSQVLFATGQVLADLPRLVQAAHDCGAMVIVDTYHSAGVLPLNWEGTGPYALGGADFVLGGSYKYTRGGPGACWLAIHDRHLHEPRLKTLDTGWFAKAEPFRYERPDPPLLGDAGDGWLESTPAVLSAYQARSGLQLVLGLGVARLNVYNREQQQQMEAIFADQGVPLFAWPDSIEQGAFALFPHRHASDLAARLQASGLNVDARNGWVRFGPDLLTTTTEMVQASQILRRVLDAWS